MKEKLETMPTIQEMLWKCDEAILNRLVLQNFARKNRRIVSAVDSAIAGMKRTIPESDSHLIVVPRIRFLSPAPDVFVKVVSVECLDGFNWEIPRRCITEKPWREVLAYYFWTGTLTPTEVHEALSCVVLGMMQNSNSDEGSTINSFLNVEESGSAFESFLVNDEPTWEKPNQQNECFDLFGIDAFACLQQYMSGLAWLKEINDAADRRFIESVKDLQFNLDQAA